MSRKIGSSTMYDSIPAKIQQPSNHDAISVAQQPYVIERLEPENFNELAELQQIAYDALDDKELYLPRSDARMKQVLSTAGFVIAARSTARQLIGARMVFVPGTSPDNMGIDLGFSADQLEQVVHLEASVIHPDYTGFGLQTTLGEHVKSHIHSLVNARYITATVSYKNVPSLRDKFRLGMAIHHIEYIRGYMRFVLVADVMDEDANWANPQTSTTEVPLTDVPTQQHLLANNYVGRRLTLDPYGAWMIHYEAARTKRGVLESLRE